MIVGPVSLSEAHTFRSRIGCRAGAFTAPRPAPVYGCAWVGTAPTIWSSAVCLNMPRHGATTCGGEIGPSLKDLGNLRPGGPRVYAIEDGFGDVSSSIPELSSPSTRAAALFDRGDDVPRDRVGSFLERRWGSTGAQHGLSLRQRRARATRRAGRRRGAGIPEKLGSPRDSSKNALSRRSVGTFGRSGALIARRMAARLDRVQQTLEIGQRHAVLEIATFAAVHARLRRITKHEAAAARVPFDPPRAIANVARKVKQHLWFCCHWPSLMDNPAWQAHSK